MNVGNPSVFKSQLIFTREFTQEKICMNAVNVGVFSRKDQLISHQRTHAGEKPYGFSYNAVNVGRPLVPIYTLLYT